MANNDLQDLVKRQELFDMSGEAVAIAQRLFEQALIEIEEEVTRIDRRIDHLEDLLQNIKMIVHD